MFKLLEKSMRVLLPSLMVTLFSVGGTFGQSTAIDSPSPITGSEINGKINARDLGDARLTTHYYVFIANPGDIGMEIAVQNFTGDIDVFTAVDLKQKTKVTIFPGMEKWETSRLIYTRQRERLLLRVEGRTPNDDPATYRIKLTGSFEILPASEPIRIDVAPPRKTGTASIRVNSVGTILSKQGEEDDTTGKRSEVAESAAQKPGKADDSGNPPVMQDPPATSLDSSLKREGAVVRNKKGRGSVVPPKKSADKSTERPAREEGKIPVESRPVETGDSSQRPSPKTEIPPAKQIDTTPSSVLRITFRNGSGLELPMDRVDGVRIEADRVRIATKDGKVRSFPLADVLKVVVE